MPVFEAHAFAFPTDDDGRYCSFDNIPFQAYGGRYLTSYKQYYRKCKICNQPYLSSNKLSVFCSEFCAKTRSPIKTEWFPHKFICKKCGTIFYSGRKTFIYCSLQCYHSKAAKYCRVCKKVMPENIKGYICSPDCHGVLRNKHNLKDKKDRMKKHPETWAKAPPKKGISINKLIMNNEYNRLYDNFFINRLIRGIGTKQN